MSTNPRPADAPAAGFESLAQELAQVRAEFQDFVYTVSHDLRAPLRHITAFTKIIEEDLPNPPPDILGHLATIRQSAQLLDQQLNGLTMLSRLGQHYLQLQAVDVSALVQAVADELTQRQPTRAVTWQLAQDVPMVWADADLLRQVFTHLLDNALKFSRSREPAQVTVSWQVAAPSDAGQAAQAGQCRISVTDNGVGFAPDQAGKLFKVFAKLHPTRDFDGLGLGLVCSRKIMQQMHGSIGIAVTLDGGCCVSLCLPLAPRMP